MSSLFSRKQFSFDSEIVTLPAYCVTGSEADSLQAKRTAQLKWMKDHGVRYLGSPGIKNDRRAARPPSASIRTRKAPHELKAHERPGDAIVRDLASNG